MNGLKVFLVVLFLIGLLFVIGLNLGPMHSGDVTIPGWMTGLGGALTRAQPLKLADLSPTAGSCLQQGNIVVPTGGTCTFNIQQSSFTLRVVALQLLEGNSAIVTFTQENVVPVQQTLTGANAMTDTNKMKVYPGKAHGMLSIACPNAAPAPSCRLELK